MASPESCQQSTPTRIPRHNKWFRMQVKGQNKVLFDMEHHSISYVSFVGLKNVWQQIEN